jgi:hypothetical protein
MTRQGSFFPLRRDMPSDAPVLFAYVLDSPVQREALQQEMLDRVSAIHALSETVAMAQLEAPDPRSHVGILDALAILSRDLRGLMEASFHPGP